MPFLHFLRLNFSQRVDTTFHNIVSNGSFLLVSTENGVEANMALGVPRQEAEKMTKHDEDEDGDGDYNVDYNGDDAQAGGGGDD